MNKLILITIFGLISFISVSQEIERNVSVSSTLYLSTISKGNLYESLESNSTGAFTFDINIPIKQKLELKTGLGYNYKFGDAYLANVNNVRVSEDFLRIPLNLNYFFPATTNGSPQFYTGLGAYLDILVSMKYQFKDERTMPINFTDSYGFGSYYKLGVMYKFGFKFSLTEKLFLDFGFDVGYDIKDLFINPDDNPSYYYTSYGFYFSLGMY
jgi:hypothetical protein